MRALLLLAILWAFPLSGDVQTLWGERAAKLRSDPSVVRFYGFQEGAGDFVANTAGKGEGTMLLVGYSPYGLYRGLPRWPAPPPEECPRWTTGRWPGKHALACGEGRQLVRSLFHGVDGPFTVEAWLRPRPRAEQEWGGGDLLAVGNAWNAGWRLTAGWAKWCPDGHAQFRLGATPGGVVCTPFNTSFNHHVPFTAGAWHHVAAVWDGKQVKLVVDGETAALPAEGKTHQPPPGKDEVGGLEIGGKLRFDLDELVIYARALTDSELLENYARFRPSESCVATPGAPAPTIPNGGYFPVGEPFDGFVPERCGLDTARAIAVVAPVAAPLPWLGVAHGLAEQPWARTLGVTWGRVVVEWPRAEPRKGLYDWSLVDRTLDTAAASGLKVVCCVVWPKWLALEPDGARQLNRFQAFLRLLSRRHTVDAWELQFQGGKQDAAAVSAAMVEALGRPLVNQGGPRMAHVDVPQPAALQIWKCVEARAAGADIVVLDCPPDEYSPAWNASDGAPSERGVALAALAAALDGAASVQKLPAPVGLTLYQAGGTTILGGAWVKLPGELKGSDFLGNPVDLAEEIDLSERPLYVAGALAPEQITLRQPKQRSEK